MDICTEEVVGNEQKLSRVCYRNERWLLDAYSQLSCARDFAPVGQFSSRLYNADRVQWRTMLTRGRLLLEDVGGYVQWNSIRQIRTHF